MKFKPATAILAFACLLLVSPASFAQDTHQHNQEHKNEQPHEDEHGHGHEAPHGGTLLVLGEEHAAHIELVLDSANGQLTGYILDGEAEKAIRISQKEIKIQISGGDVGSSIALTLKPVESPLTGEKAGDTSQFEAASEALKGKSTFDITIEDVTVKGHNYKNTASKFPEGNH